MAVVLSAVLSAWADDCRPLSGEATEVFGLSGARLWRLDTPRGSLCLRRWPVEHPSPDRLRLIHAVLRHAAERGFNRLPVPLATSDGETFVRHVGHLWELAPWMPGRADFAERPSRVRLENAMAALAQFHCAVADFPHGGPAVGRSPGLGERGRLLDELLAGEVERLRGAIRPHEEWPTLDGLAGRVVALVERLAPAAAAEVHRAAERIVPLVPAIRDIHDEHVLFVGDEVSGLIDFGAMRIDSVAADVARLLGSMAGGEAGWWHAGEAAYAAALDPARFAQPRPWTDELRTAVPAFDLSGMVLAGANWLRWIYVEGRSFPSRQAVLRRVERIAARLEHMVTG